MIVVRPPCAVGGNDMDTRTGVVTADMATRIVTLIFGVRPSNATFGGDDLVRPHYRALNQEDLEAGQVGDRSGFWVPRSLLAERNGYRDHPDWLFGKEGED